MEQRIATCGCGGLQVVCSGDPVRISMRHCLACQRRTGARFGVQSWFQRDQVCLTGTSTAYTRTAASGNNVAFQSCPTCGSTVYWELSGRPGAVAIALGRFADPDFPPPRVSVWERRRHPWTVPIADCQMEHNA